MARRLALRDDADMENEDQPSTAEQRDAVVQQAVRTARYLDWLARRLLMSDAIEYRQAAAEALRMFSEVEPKA
jgi:hypothetical protein